MDSNGLEKYRKILLSKREGILNTSKNHLKDAREFGAEAVHDIADEGSASYNRMVFAALGEVEKRQIVEIDDALARIKEGAYGRCQECDQEIDEKRLNAKPESIYCIECQKTMEGGR